MNRAIAVIPARAGSERVRNKNFRTFKGTHLTEIALNVAKEAGFFWKIILSTDSPQGEEIADRLNVIFHQRSGAASSSSATATDTVKDLENKFAAEGVLPTDYIYYLQPTSPLRTVDMLIKSWAELLSSDGPGLVSVVPVNPKYSKIMRITDGVLASNYPESVISSNQQSLDPLFLANGNVFAFKYELFARKQIFPLLGLIPLVQQPNESLDIDSDSDFRKFSRSYFPGKFLRH